MWRGNVHCGEKKLTKGAAAAGIGLLSVLSVCTVEGLLPRHGKHLFLEPPVNAKNRANLACLELPNVVTLTLLSWGSNDHETRHRARN
jgi:hypothetical protein